VIRDVNVGDKVKQDVDVIDGSFEDVISDKDSIVDVGLLSLN
jgi:hypothetical protein